MTIEDLRAYDPGDLVRNWLSKYDLSDTLINAAGFIVDAVSLALLVIITDFITRKILLSLIHRIVSRTKVKWDDYFYEQKVFRNLAHLVPAIVVRSIVPDMFRDLGEGLTSFIITLTDVYIAILITIVISRCLKAFEGLSESEDNNFNYPQIRTISQVLRIVLTFIAFLVIISILFNIKVGGLLGGLAGATAIIILIFQDTINGLLANFQINMYDMFRKGDWITFTKFGVDGTVISIDLTTVKIQNWDKTISSIPAKAFVQDSFINWRGMQETNSRRIKRNILIDINSIRYLNDIDISNFSQIDLVSEYVQNKESEIEESNTSTGVNSKLAINGRRQTNIGLYRAYVKAYLQQHPSINKGLTMMVRQLQPTPEGIPIEVYCFSSDIEWVRYEGIQSDIFDHLFAATGYFDLKLFQAPSGKSIESLKD